MVRDQLFGIRHCSKIPALTLSLVLRADGSLCQQLHTKSACSVALIVYEPPAWSNMRSCMNVVVVVDVSLQIQEKSQITS